MQETKRNDYRVLFLTRQFAPLPKVSEICVKRVREALFERGIRSDVLQFTGREGVVQTDDIGIVFSAGAGEDRLNTTSKNKLTLFLNKALIAYRWPYYFTYAMNRKYLKTARKLCNDVGYDAVIGMALPVDTVLTGIKCNDFVFYELDAISNNPTNNGFVKSLLKRRVFRIEQLVMDKSALIIHMDFNKEYYSKESFSKYRKKSVYASIPNLIDFSIENEGNNKDKEFLLLSYFGTLMRNFRNPEYLIRLLESLSKQIPVRCEFYSRGNCEDILAEAELKNPGVIVPMGYVTPEEVVLAQNSADFLLSIGNSLSGEDRSLPSKILEYIAIGKPIIHISGGANDSALAYLKKYGLACIIDPNHDHDDNVASILSFIKNNAGVRVPFERVRQLFPENTPDYTADIIERFLNDRMPLGK